MANDKDKTTITDTTAQMREEMASLKLTAVERAKGECMHENAYIPGNSPHLIICPDCGATAFIDGDTLGMRRHISAISDAVNSAKFHLNLKSNVHAADSFNQEDLELAGRACEILKKFENKLSIVCHSNKDLHKINNEINSMQQGFGINSMPSNFYSASPYIDPINPYCGANPVYSQSDNPFARMGQQMAYGTFNGPMAPQQNIGTLPPRMNYGAFYQAPRMQTPEEEAQERKFRNQFRNRHNRHEEPDDEDEDD